MRIDAEDLVAEGLDDPELAARHDGVRPLERSEPRRGLAAAPARARARTARAAPGGYLEADGDDASGPGPRAAGPGGGRSRDARPAVARQPAGVAASRRSGHHPRDRPARRGRRSAPRRAPRTAGAARRQPRGAARARLRPSAADAGDRDRVVRRRAPECAPMRWRRSPTRSAASRSDGRYERCCSRTRRRRVPRAPTSFRRCAPPTRHTSERALLLPAARRRRQLSARA